MKIPKDIPAAMTKKLSSLSFDELDTLMARLGCPEFDTKSKQYRAERARAARLVELTLRTTAAFPWLAVLEAFPIVPHMRVGEAGAPPGDYQVTEWRSQSGVSVYCEPQFSRSGTARRSLQVTTIRSTDVGKLALVFFPKPGGIQSALVAFRQDADGAATGKTVPAQLPGDTLVVVALVELNPASTPDLKHLEYSMMCADSDLDWVAWAQWFESQVVRRTISRSQADAVQSAALMKRHARARIGQKVEAWLEDAALRDSSEGSSEGPEGLPWVDKGDDGADTEKPRRR